MYINQVLTVLKALVKFLDDGRKKLVEGTARAKHGMTEVLSVNEFLFRTHTDNINLFRLEKFFKISEISKKVNGFVLKQAAVDSTTPTPGTANDDGCVVSVSYSISTRFGYGRSGLVWFGSVTLHYVIVLG